MEVKDVAQVQSTIDPLMYRQVLAALDVGGSEEAMLSYLSYVSNYVPMTRIQFLHVVPETTFLAGLFEKELKDEQSMPVLSTQVESLIKNMVMGQFGSQTKTQLEFQVLEGNPLSILLDAAQEIKADLMVLGHRYGRSHQGILAKKLVRKSDCDVLIVPESAPEKIKEILVPIDFSDHAGRALQNAVALANRLGDDVKIKTVHVYSFPNMSAYQIDRTYAEYQTILLQNLQDAQDSFFETYVPNDKARIEPELVYKDMPGTARYLSQVVEQSGADLVIMGAKGHSTVDRLLIGSVTEAFMMIKKETPVLIIR